ncbi:hypothetical protein ACXX9E_29535 [Pseudomonas sp. GNP014]
MRLRRGVVDHRPGGLQKILEGSARTLRASPLRRHLLGDFHRRANPWFDSGSSPATPSPDPVLIARSLFASTDIRSPAKRSFRRCPWKAPLISAAASPRMSWTWSLKIAQAVFALEASSSSCGNRHSHQRSVDAVIAERSDRHVNPVQWCVLLFTVAPDRRRVPP